MILITGGLGYIGSHMALYLMSKGHEVVLADNLSQSSMAVLERLEYITKMYIPFVRLDVRNTPVLQKVFEQYTIDYVIHAAGFKSLEEAKSRPMEYYNNNVGCMMSLLRALQRSNVKRLVNLSSISVYGASGHDWREDSELQNKLSNPYINGQKMIEQMLQDTYQADPMWQIINVRLSNVIGAYGSNPEQDSPLGEWTPLAPKSVLPNMLQVAAGQKDAFDIHQHGLDTKDGTAERNYIHVMDAIEAVYQLMLWSNTQANLFESFNVVSDDIVSLKQLLQSVERVTGQTLATLNSEEQRLSFDKISANNQKLKSTTPWQSKRTLDDAVRSQWQYYQSILGIAS
ncbi:MULTISPECIES: SDR family NAD(P)-dependent oxidoreductase [unclassified Acinetobacter]|uniref:SDR family NAD(P)-dependent oxidoreductase n=1 Tax=unclassified Acinetobacter TaxID=196816 RepID=UPI0035B88B9A